MEIGDILFWIVAAALAGFAVVTLVRAAGRPAPAVDDPGDIAVYRAQLDDVARDLERGTVMPDEAERLRTEIGRRILAADKASFEPDAGPDAAGPALTVAILLSIAVSFALYAWIGAPGYPDLPHAQRVAAAEQLRAERPTQAEAEERMSTQELTDPSDPRMAELIHRLRSAVAERPNDLAGQELLARNEAALGNAAAAARAQERVLALKASEATAGDFAMLADNLIIAAGGYVSPEAEATLAATLSVDPRNGTARFYSGLLEAQTGRPDRAFAIWRELLETSPPDAPWVPAILDRIGLLADAAGVNYAPPAPAPGPDAGDVAAASDMSAEDRDAMIRGMVDQLGARLASEGGTPEDWSRMIASLAVLGEVDRAREILAEAEQVFSAESASLETIRRAASEAGVTE